MKVLLTGRGFDITPAIKSFVNERIEKLGKFLDEIIEVHCILTVEKYRHQAEVSVHTRRRKLSSTALSGDMYSSLQSVFNKLETQAKKLKEKRKERKRKDSEKRVTQVEPTPAGELSGRIVRVDNFNLRPMSAEDAVLRMTTDKSDFFVFRSITTDSVAVVYRRKDGNVGLIEPEF
ncbi:MAG: ribosome-associated translation inhibitor RaiA [Acidobacteriota bacterium]